MKTNKKIMSINLWYDKYSNKTDGQLKAFRNLGYETHVATVVKNQSGFSLSIINVTGINNSEKEQIESESFLNYKKIFRYLFDYCASNEYSFVYIRRLMSKLLQAAPFFKDLSKECPIVYEIPTYPLDTGNSLVYRVRDKVEMFVYKHYNRYIKLTLANVIDNVTLPKGWEVFYNAIDMDGYELSAVPPLNDTLKMLIVANISEYHRYDRILDSIKKYVDTTQDMPNTKMHPNIHLTVISPESNAYNYFKEKTSALSLNDYVTFLDKLSTSEIREVAKDCHIGIGQLSTSEKGSNLVNTLKSKDYCAMGLPFVSTCYDTSFEKDFPYIYISKNMDSEIDLANVIDWYKNIRKDSLYKEKMYNYAKENLQYDKFALQIIEAITKESHICS